MKIKAVSALLLTLVLVMAALASEQRRLHCDVTAVSEVPAVVTRD
jgi:hypothetical protein